MDKTDDDCNAMVMELTILASGCDAIRVVCDSLNVPPIVFPAVTKKPQKALFEHVSDYAKTPLSYDTHLAWSPRLTLSQLREDVLCKHFLLDRTAWKVASLPEGPISNLTSVPITGNTILDFSRVLYVPIQSFPRFLRVPDSPDRHLVRGEIEPAADAYTAAKHCRF